MHFWSWKWTSIYSVSRCSSNRGLRKKKHHKKFERSEKTGSRCFRIKKIKCLMQKSIHTSIQRSPSTCIRGKFIWSKRSRTFNIFGINIQTIQRWSHDPVTWPCHMTVTWLCHLTHTHTAIATYVFLWLISLRILEVQRPPVRDADLWTVRSGRRFALIRSIEFAFADWIATSGGVFKSDQKAGLAGSTSRRVRKGSGFRSGADATWPWPLFRRRRV